MIGKALEYAYVAWTYVRGPFSYVVGFIGRHPKTSLALFAASHALRSML